jgi:hypothetical protein
MRRTHFVRETGAALNSHVFLLRARGAFAGFANNMRGNPTKAKIDGAENVRYDVSIRLCGRKVRAKRKRRK